MNHNWESMVNVQFNHSFAEEDLQVRMGPLSACMRTQLHMYIDK